MIIEVAEQVNQQLLHFQSKNKAASAQPNISILKVVLILPIDRVFCELRRLAVNRGQSVGLPLMNFLIRSVFDNGIEEYTAYEVVLFLKLFTDLYELVICFVALEFDLVITG